MKGIEKIVKFYEEKNIVVDAGSIEEYIQTRVCELGINGVNQIEADYFENGKKNLCYYEVKATTTELENGDFDTEIEVLSVH